MGFNPYEEVVDFCDVCGRLTEYCICPECWICHVNGNPDCYNEDKKQYHGMKLTEEQKGSKYVSEILKELEWDRE